MPVQPFFSRYLESQNAASSSRPSTLADTSRMVTMRYPSDSDNIDPCHSPRLPDFLKCHDHHHCHEPSSPVTLKFPSDSEDGGDNCCCHDNHQSGGIKDLLERLQQFIQSFLQTFGFGSRSA